MSYASEQPRAKVVAQAIQNSAMYGNVDFEVTPERFVADINIESAVREELLYLRPSVLSDNELMERIKAYTMLGDVVADAYVALLPQFGMRKLMAMVELACERGVEAVEGAPPELASFIGSMERTPSWVDMNLVAEGARLERNVSANLAPFTVRGAFLATFMNKYAALPMALTGTLSHEAAARRVRETATFFTTSVLPGALDRYGPGFRAAALVRLMHSVVRFNVLRTGQWDVSTYGIPIPQVDQMPAGLIGATLLSLRVVRAGRKTFTRSERARVELSRYRCFLLGLPEDLLSTTPEGILRMMTARSGTLRKAYDDATCGELVRATMAAYLPTKNDLGHRIHDRFERSFAKVFFVKNFMQGDIQKASAIGVVLTRQDRFRALAVLSVVATRMVFYSLTAKLPLAGKLADRALVKRLKRLLKEYGHAAYTSDGAAYRSATH
ncbi:oxygenase MpaB family protein [Paraburkholderia sp. J12]|uniref:oxygenase MpaB family protein n=1 Tax=Paraburkholderia sp. J12 TaxID=2805432 RepID=UPI002ABD6A1D|nr:oxygenase MpaB family protein [Paraburkholderia sp. J12]